MGAGPFDNARPLAWFRNQGWLRNRG